MPRLSLRLLPLLASAAITPAQVLDWQQVPIGAAVSPQGRGYPAMVFDKANQNVVMFGGYNASERNDTWIWSGFGWTQANPTHQPPARQRASMVYDEARGVVMMFGGRVGSTVNGDMWTWDGTDWTQVTTPNMPPPRAGALMAYDPLRQVVVMFGGSDGTFFSGRTYEYDGVDWTERFPSQIPPQRASGLAWFDATTGNVRIYGGAVSPSYLSSYDDVWSWDGSNWSNDVVAAPRGRGGTMLAFSQDLQAPVRYGGNTAISQTVYSDQAYFDGTSWQTLVGSVPGPRAEGAMVYDEARQELMMFGGRSTFLASYPSDTWVSGQSLPQATATVYGSNCAQTGNTILSSLPVIGSSASILITQAPSTVAFLMIGTSGTTFQGAPLPIDLGSFGLTGCQLLTSADVLGLPFSVVSPAIPLLRRDENIPNDLNLVGQQVFLQAFALAPGANPAQVLTSSGVEWTFGPF
jgi:hypothetical protein